MKYGFIMIGFITGYCLAMEHHEYTTPRRTRRESVDGRGHSITSRSPRYHHNDYMERMYDMYDSESDLFRLIWYLRAKRTQLHSLIKDAQKKRSRTAVPQPVQSDDDIERALQLIVSSANHTRPADLLHSREHQARRREIISKHQWVLNLLLDHCEKEIHRVYEHMNQSKEGCAVQ